MRFLDKLFLAIGFFIQVSRAIIILKKALSKLIIIGLGNCCFFFPFLQAFLRLYVFVMSRTRFRVDPHSIVAWVSRNSLLKAGAKSAVQVTATGLELSGSEFKSRCVLRVYKVFKLWNIETLTPFWIHPAVPRFIKLY